MTRSFRLPTALAASSSSFAVGAALLLATGCSGPAADSEATASSAPAKPAEAAAPAARSTIAFTLAERDLLPENVAYDPVDEAFYVGSTRKGKVVKITADGTVSDFVAPRQDGLWMAVGMKVDAARRHLWVASAGGDNLEGYSRKRGRSAGIFQFDLADGSLIEKWTLESEGGTHFFNDLVVTEAGDVYATHMFNQAAVYVIQAANRKLQVFARPGDFRNPNGLTFGDDGWLYVAHQGGISAFDPATADRRRLAAAEGVTLPSRIDGLYFHNGSLIAFHPDEQVIRRYTLDAGRQTLAAVEDLDSGHPRFNDPVTGVLVGDALYYVANSQFGLVADGQLPPPEEMDEVVIRRLDLS